MMLDAMAAPAGQKLPGGYDNWDLWMGNGGKWYPLHTADMSHAEQKELETIRSQLHRLPYAIELDTGHGHKIGIVHAEVSGNWGDLEGDLEIPSPRFGLGAADGLLWNRTYGTNKPTNNPMYRCRGIDMLVAGHTPRKDAPALVANRLYIDGGGFIKHRDYGYPGVVVVAVSEIAENIDLYTGSDYAQSLYCKD
jgi:hypothetical protein